MEPVDSSDMDPRVSPEEFLSPQRR
jgi:hypothetical protein